MRATASACLLLATLACGPTDDEPSEDDAGADDGDDGSDGDGAPIEQPGLDDPTARAWTKAGKWYPEDPAELDEAVEALIAEVGEVEPRRAVAILPPHASLRYSGPTGKEVWARVAIPPTVLTIAPDHFHDGADIGVWTEGPWLIPGHAVEIDRDLLARVQDALPELPSDRDIFSHHETEMLLPWLTTLRPDVKFVPIAIHDNEHKEYPDWDLPRIEAWGIAIADLLRGEAEAGREVLLVGTTDLVHHEPLELAEEQDTAMMDFITALDVEGLHQYVVDNEVTVCGEIPVSIMMVALRELGHDHMELLERGNSLHVNGDEDDIIGYPAAAAWAD